MNKYRAAKWQEKDTNKEHYYVERTHPIYGYPAIEIPNQPRFETYEQAKLYAKKLNNEVEQLRLF